MFGALLAVVVAYHYSLVSLTRTLNLDTPLAYLGLVPFLALGLAAVSFPRTAGEPAIHDRQLDYIVGVPLLVVALVMVLLGPLRLSSLFWVWRVDLLSLPIFVAGVLVIVFGLRAMWRVRFAIGFLLLAWPLPYLRVLNGLMNRSAELTLAAVRAALSVVPLAEPVAHSDGSLFRIGRGSSRFVVSVTSACSGVNGMLGFLLVGAAFSVMVRGGRLRKLAWLTTGTVVLGVVNVGRILVIFGVGAAAGERVALEVLHPVLGLITFSAGVLLMVALLPRFGLHLPARAGATPPPAHGDGPAAGRRRRRAATGPIGCALVAIVTLVTGLANAGLRQYSEVADFTGRPRLASYAESPTQLSQWSMSVYDSYDTGKRFFGRKSTWTRFLYTSTTAIDASGPARAATPVMVDVISTPSRQSLVDYGLEACYRFHGYKLRQTSRVDVGGGVVGTLISFYNQKDDRDWSTLHWEAPVRTGGGGVRYERVVFMMIDARNRPLAPPPPGPTTRPDLGRSLGKALDNRVRSSAQDEVDQDLLRVSNFLVAFGRAVLREQVANSQQTGVA